MGKHRGKGKDVTPRHKLSKSSRFEAACDGTSDDFDSLQNDRDTRGIGLKMTKP